MRRAWLPGVLLLLLAASGCAAPVHESEDLPPTVAESREQLLSPAWSSVYGGSPFLSSSRSSCTVSRGGNAYEVWISEGANLRQRVFDGASWGSWQTEAISLPVGYLAGGVACAYKDGGYIEQVVRGSDNEVWHRWRPVTGAWSAWSADAPALGGVTAQSPAISITANGSVQVWLHQLYVPGYTLDALVMKRWSGSWASWTAFPLPAGVTMDGPPAASRLSPTSNLVRIAFRATNGSSYTADYTDGGSTTLTWTSHPAGGTIAGQPHAVSNGVVWALTSSGLRYKVKTLGWSTWTALSDSTPPPSFAFGLSAASLPAADEVLAFDSSSVGWERRSYAAPAPVLTGDRILRAAYQGATFDETCAGTYNKFENSALVAPPSLPGCPAGGRVFLSSGAQVGTEHGGWYGDAACIRDGTGALAGCAGGDPPQCDATSYDLLPQYPPGNPALVFASFASNDNQAFILGNNLYSVRQAVATGSPALQRGVETIYRSTNCGAAWTNVARLDACDATFNPGTPGCALNLGFDRPEVATSDVNGDVFMTVNAGDTFALKGTNGASTWTKLRTLPWALPTPVTTTRGDMLAFSDNGDLETSPAYPLHKHLVLRTTDTTTGAGFNFDLGNAMQTMGGGPALSSLKSSCVAGPHSPTGVMRVGAYDVAQSGTVHHYIRLIYPVLNAASDPALQRYRAAIVRVTKSASGFSDPTVIGSVELPITNPAGSVFHMVALDADRGTLAPGANAPAVSLLYWYETSTTPAQAVCNAGPNGFAPAASWGAVTVRGCIVRDLDLTCTPFTLATTSAGVPRSWNGYATWGHYQKGAFWYDPAAADGRTYNFFAQWQESVAGDWIHFNVVRVAP